MTPIFNILRPGGFGDVVFTSAVTTQMKQRGYEVHYYTSCTELARLLDGVDKVFPTSQWDQRSKGKDWSARYGEVYHRHDRNILDIFCEDAGVENEGMKLRDIVRRGDPSPYITLQREAGCSSLKEYERWDEVIAGLRQKGITLPVVELGPRWAWLYTCGLLQHASLHLGIDSVCTHIASAYGTPSVVVWGSSSPVIFGHKNQTNLSNSPPKCHPCLIEDRRSDGHRSNYACPIKGCSKLIVPPVIIQAALQLLNP
jgi:ADP-heptose:LPS heptosyltransferase